MTWQEDEEPIGKWLLAAHECGGSFVKMFAETSMRADSENYLILRPALLQLMQKYPSYSEGKWANRRT